MAPRPARIVSEVVQTILAQVQAQCALKPAVVRQGTDTLQIHFSELGSNTLRIKNLHDSRPEDGNLLMDVTIRYNREMDCYDALVGHLRPVAEGIGFERHYEMIDEIYVDQFPELLAGDYCGDPDNTMTKVAAEAWEKRDFYQAPRAACAGMGM